MQDATLTEANAPTIEQIYRDHGDRLWRAVLLYTADPEIASDAVAEAFAQAISREEHIDQMLPWLWKAAFGIAARELRRRRRTMNPLPDAAYTFPDPLPELMAALRRISPKERASLVLHHYAGYSTAEIARMLGSTPSAVGVHLHRGRARLRTLLEDLRE